MDYTLQVMSELLVYVSTYRSKAGSVPCCLLNSLVMFFEVYDIFFNNLRSVCQGVQDFRAQEYSDELSPSLLILFVSLEGTLALNT